MVKMSDEDLDAKVTDECSSALPEEMISCKRADTNNSACSIVSDNKDFVLQSHDDAIVETAIENAADLSSTGSSTSLLSPSPSSPAVVVVSAPSTACPEWHPDSVKDYPEWHPADPSTGAEEYPEWQPGEWSSVEHDQEDYSYTNGVGMESESTMLNPHYSTANLPTTAGHFHPQFMQRQTHMHNHQVCSTGAALPHSTAGSHSPHLHSPSSHSGASSPHDSGCGSSVSSALPASQQYVVNVHVNPGETFSVRVGDQVQMIQGPATVRMVSNAEPPMPMPMQVPPGHMVQQFVDEHGILTHVILSPQPPGMPSATMMGTSNGGAPHQIYTPYGPSYPSYPSHFPPHHHHHPIPLQRHMHPMPPHVHSPPVSSVNNLGQPNAVGLSNANIDFRAQKTKQRLQEKLSRRRSNNEDGSTSSSTQMAGGAASSTAGNNKNTVNRGSPLANSSIDGRESEDDDDKLIKEMLSKVEAPKVSNVDGRSALIQLTTPDYNASELNIEPSEFQYQLQLSEKKDDNSSFTEVYSGDATEITLSDLKPNTNYFVSGNICLNRVCCLLDNLTGDPGEVASFTTLSAEPDPPPRPKLTTKTKTSLLLKWNAGVDNGSKITSYSLEYDQGQGDSNFIEVYNGLQRTFKVTKLSPSMSYVFRLAAINAIGKSQYCEPIRYFTSGTVPSQTDPPMLSEPSVKSLTISWIKRPSDDSFTLQMEDEATGHGFLTVFNGSDLSYKIPNLRRNTEYKFRLQASNEEGSSKWSDVVCYRTLPDRPFAPQKPQLKGKASSSSFRITFDEPKDGGGVEVGHYIIQLDAGNGYQQIHETKERDHTVDQLEPGHTYRVRLQAVGPGGQSEFSEVLTVTMQPVSPGPCKPPRLQGGRPKATFLNVCWDEPEYDGGSQVTEYAVLVTNHDLTSREVYRGQEMTCVVASLLPGRMYRLQVKAFNKAGAGPWSEAFETLTGASIPDAPNQPEIHCKSPHTAVVSWEEPVCNGSAITEYRLEWQVPKDDVDFAPLFCGPALFFEVSRLSPATAYAFRVQAVNNMGVGPASVVGTCLTPPSSPGPVVTLRASATATSITLAWKEPLCNGSRIVSYNIDIGEHHILSVESMCEYVVEDLLPETTYKVRIQAVNSIGVGAFSSPIKVTTQSLPPNPPNIECNYVGPKFLKLKWGEGKNLDMIQYCLEMAREGGSFQPIYQGTAYTHKVTKLSEMTEYLFRIYAINNAGDGPLSHVFRYTTTKAPPAALKAPKVCDISLTGCSVEWAPLKISGTDSLAYVLQLQPVSGKDQNFHEVYRGADVSFTITNLLPRTKYQVRVCAVRQCDDGNLVGPFSPTTDFTTNLKQSSTANSSTGNSKTFASTALTESTAVVSGACETSPTSFLNLSERNWAFLILAVFALFAVLVAYFAKQLIDFSANGSRL